MATYLKISEKKMSRSSSDGKIEKIGPADLDVVSEKSLCALSNGDVSDDLG